MKTLLVIAALLISALAVWRHDAEIMSAALLLGFAGSLPRLDASRYRIVSAAFFALMLTVIHFTIRHTFIVPTLFLACAAAWGMQYAIHCEIEYRGRKRSAPLEEQIGGQAAELDELTETHEMQQKVFQMLSRRFQVVRSFGASLRFDVAWQDIERGALSLLGAKPLLYLPRLAGGIPDGIVPYSDNSLRILDEPEWRKALAGNRVEESRSDGKSVEWIPLKLGDGQLAVLHVVYDPEKVPTDAVKIFSTQTQLLLEKMRLYAEVELQSRTDLMTQLPHHASFKQILAEEIARSGLTGKPLALLMVDLDHFKAVNDTYGHLAGDQVLIAVAHRIRDMLRISDTVARYGGEEFGVILPETPLETAAEIAERIREAVASMPIPLRVDASEQVIHKTLSIGLAGCPLHAGTPQDLAAAADAALYVAKRGGRNRVEIAEK